MLMEGLVGITALIAARVMPPEDYVAINTDPKIAMVASPATKGAGLAHSVEQLAAADPALTDHDRGILGLAPGQSLTSLSEASYPASKLLALSSGTLARLDYSVDQIGRASCR